MPKAQKWDCEWSRLSHGTSVGFVFIEIDAQWILGGEGRPHGSLGTDGGATCRRTLGMKTRWEGTRTVSAIGIRWGGI